MDTEKRAVIKHGQGTKELLENRLGRLAMEMKQINSILQIAVSIFNSPAQMVKLFQLSGRKLFTRQIGYKAFIATVSKHNADKTERDGVSSRRIPQIKCMAVNPYIAIILLVDSGTTGCQYFVHIYIKFTISREMQRVEESVAV